MEEAVKVTSHEALGSMLISEKVQSAVQEFGNNFDRMLAVHGSHEQSCSPCLTSGQDETCSLDQDHLEQSCDHRTSSDRYEKCNSEEIRMCHDFCQSLSLNERKPKGFNKCVTFPCSERVQSHSSSIEEKEGLVPFVIEGQCSSKSDSAAYTRSISMPASFRGVSAMKGGREHKGGIPKMKLHVKWAPEVYDPPVTSMSHTVNHTKSKKDHQKHKQSKGKSSRRTEKKYAGSKKCGSKADPPNLRSFSNISYQ